MSAVALVRTGLVLEVIGLAGLGLVAANTDADWWPISRVLFFYGIGVGSATSQVTNVALADVPTSEGGQSSGIQSTFRQLGSALGIAALTTVFYSAPGGGLQSRLTDAGVPRVGLLPGRGVPGGRGGGDTAPTRWEVITP